MEIKQMEKLFFFFQEAVGGPERWREKKQTVQLGHSDRDKHIHATNENQAIHFAKTELYVGDFQRQNSEMF